MKKGCKTCQDEVETILGIIVYSFQTFGLTCHIKKHQKEWQVYLDLLGGTITHDIKTPLEHHKAMSKQKVNTDKEESDRCS